MTARALSEFITLACNKRRKGLEVVNTSTVHFPLNAQALELLMP